jgi:hypothetical protein
MIDTKLRKTPVRWSDADIEKVWEALPAVIEKHRKRGLTWQIEQAGQAALGERWKRIPSFANVPSLLLQHIAKAFPELKRAYPQLENVNQIPLDKEAFINLVAEARLTKPFDDFVDIWNDCISLVPELGLPEVSHSKYIDQEYSKLIQKHCDDLLLPEPEVPIEPDPEPPKLEDSKAEDLIRAYHIALVRELRAPAAPPAPAPAHVKVETNGTNGVHAPLKPIMQTPAPLAKLQTVITNRVTTANGDHDDGEHETCGRQKIRVAVVDHNTSRTPTDFERAYDKHPKFKFKFMFMQIGATGVPVFKSGGYAIISESAPISWKQDAVRICGRPNVSIVNGSRDSVNDAMQKLIKTLEASAVAKA